MWNAEGTLKFIYFPQSGIMEFEGAEIEATIGISIVNEMSSGAAASGGGETAAPRVSAGRAARPGFGG